MAFNKSWTEDVMTWATKNGDNREVRLRGGPSDDNCWTDWGRPATTVRGIKPFENNKITYMVMSVHFQTNPYAEEKRFHRPTLMAGLLTRNSLSEDFDIPIGVYRGQGQIYLLENTGRIRDRSRMTYVKSFTDQKTYTLGLLFDGHASLAFSLNNRYLGPAFESMERDHLYYPVLFCGQGVEITARIELCITTADYREKSPWGEGRPIALSETKSVNSYNQCRAVLDKVFLKHEWVWAEEQTASDRFDWTNGDCFIDPAHKFFGTQCLKNGGKLYLWNIGITTLIPVLDEVAVGLGDNRNEENVAYSAPTTKGLRIPHRTSDYWLISNRGWSLYRFQKRFDIESFDFMREYEIIVVFNKSAGILAFYTEGKVLCVMKDVFCDNPCPLIMYHGKVLDLSLRWSTSIDLAKSEAAQQYFSEAFVNK